MLDMIACVKADLEVIWFILAASGLLAVRVCCSYRFIPVFLPGVSLLALTLETCMYCLSDLLQGSVYL